MQTELVFNLSGRREDYSEGDPETSVGRKSGGTKGVSNGHFPKIVN